MTTTSTSASSQTEFKPSVVLFVDDDEGILAGLKATARRVRREYIGHFARDYDSALSILQHEPVDVLVTEIRLPGRDGIELLRSARRDHPSTIRCILTGETEEGSVLRAATVAHRWLSKPCDRDQLVAALTDAVRHRKLLSDPALRATIAGADVLPTPPRLYLALLEVVSQPDSSMDEIADLVSQDPALSAKLLQWANSAFCGSAPVVDLRSAVVRIGLSTLTQLVLLAEVAMAFDHDGLVPGLDAELFHSHVGLVGSIAEQLVDPQLATVAATGGLFNNIGLLLEATYLPERLAEAYATAATANISLIEAEQQLYGITHPELGAHLLSLWGFPSEIVLLIAGSHQPPTGEFPMTPLEAVRVARILASRVHQDKLGAPHLDRPTEEIEAIVNRALPSLPDCPGAKP